MLSSQHKGKIYVKRRILWSTTVSSYNSSVDDVFPDEFEAEYLKCSSRGGMDFLGALGRLAVNLTVRSGFRWKRRLLNTGMRRIERGCLVVVCGTAIV